MEEFGVTFVGQMKKLRYGKKEVFLRNFFYCVRVYYGNKFVYIYNVVLKHGIVNEKNICASALLLFVLGCSNSESPVGVDSMQVAESSVNVLTKAFFATKSLSDLKKYVKKNLPSGTKNRKYTESNLDKLFDYWMDL